MNTLRHVLSLLLLMALSPVHAAELVVGQVAPLSGVLAATGAQMVLGARICFEHVNATGGIHGAKIRHVVKDDAYKIEETIRLTQEAIERDKVVALIGFAGTANLTELLRRNILQQANIALVAPYTGGEPLRSPFNPSLFHIRAGYADEAEHMVGQLVTLGIKDIGVYYQNDGFGKAGLAGVEAALQRRELKLLASAPYERNKLDDSVAQAVAAFRQSGVSAIIMISINPTTAAFVKAFRAAGGNAQLFNISVVDPAELVRLAGVENMHGLGISQVVPFPYSPTLPVIREFRELFAKYAPKEATLSYTSFEEFIGAKVLVEGLRRAGPRPTPEKVLRALESLGRHDVGGFQVNFSRDNRIGSKYVEVTVIGREGKLLR
ncbi:MAG: ABC transporter substrate-binding protein [Rhodocyclaceae bacterium]|nr:ABC transporter substrate-binding protein [Rhodocyclaceae bacterium]